MKPLILLTTGGTGGHIFPAEALAEELEAKGFRTVFITDKRGSKIKTGFKDIYVVKASGIAGHGIKRKIGSAIGLLAGFLQAFSIIINTDPKVVVGFGGYASVPALAAATILGKKIVLHEQNAVFGRANRTFARYADVIATSFEEVKYLNDKKHQKYTGMPVRKAIAEARKTPYSSTDEDINVLVLGGSQGATVFSDVIPEAFKNLSVEIQKKLSVVQQCRKEDLEKVKDIYASTEIKTELDSFFDDVPERLKKANLVISRSGASSVSEISAAGRPAILVPLPNSIDDHQKVNAKALSDAGGGWLMEQKDFTPENLSKKLEELFSSTKTLAEAAKNSQESGKIDAAAELAEIIIEMT